MKETLDERNYNSKAQETIVLYHIPESTPHAVPNVQTFCEKLKVAPSRIKKTSQDSVNSSQNQPLDHVR